MGISSFLQSASRLLRTISKPDWKTYWLSIKIVMVGVAALGAVGYLIKLISITLSPA
ncbi:MAG TPA: protein translocase SEC61 complex subunit gamma [Patescibacteria group bacterium]|nr:protein translocase SEC61 complex subunit gamma [Patescibacteria group bacterium]